MVTVDSRYTGRPDCTQAKICVILRLGASSCHSHMTQRRGWGGDQAWHYKLEMPARWLSHSHDHRLYIHNCANFMSKSQMWKLTSSVSLQNYTKVLEKSIRLLFLKKEMDSLISSHCLIGPTVEGQLHTRFHVSVQLLEISLFSINHSLMSQNKRLLFWHNCITSLKNLTKRQGWLKETRKTSNLHLEREKKMGGWWGVTPLFLLFSPS